MTDSVGFGITKMFSLGKYKHNDPKFLYDYFIKSTILSAFLGNFKIIIEKEPLNVRNLTVFNKISSELVRTKHSNLEEVADKDFLSEHNLRIKSIKMTYLISQRPVS